MSIVETVRDRLHYDPETGVFTWRQNVAAVRAGSEAGYCSGGYRQIGIDGKIYTAHRLAWLYMTGKWPAVEIDHANGDKSDNRWANLRECVRSENNENLGVRTDNKSGHPGVWQLPTGKWTAQIQKHGKRHCLGNHATFDGAKAAYLRAKARLHTFQPTPREEKVA